MSEQKTATELEKDYAWASLLARWYQSRSYGTKSLIFGFGGGGLAAGAIIAVGLPSIAVGALGGVVVRYGFPALSDLIGKLVPEKYQERYKKLNPFADFHKDSTVVLDAREKLESEWTKAAAAGMSYKEFRKKNKGIRKEYSKQLRHDTYYRTVAVGVTTFAGLGITHFRTDILDWMGGGIDHTTGVNGLGEKVVYGERLLQRASRYVTHQAMLALAAIADIQIIDQAHAGPRYSTEAIVVERKSPPGIPVLEDGLTEVNRTRTIHILERHIAWLGVVRNKFAGVMGFGNGATNEVLRNIDTAIEKLQKTLKFIRTASLSRLPNSEGLKNFKDLVKPAYQAAADLNSIPPYGSVYYMGSPHPLEEVTGLRFKHAGFDLLPQEASRALYEFWVSIYRAVGADLPYGWTITEGHNPDMALSHPHESSGHRTGMDFDSRPTGPGGPNDSSYGRRMMRNPSFVYKVLTSQIGNNYFTTRFEPGDLDPKGEMRAYAKSWLAWPKIFGGAGMTQDEAERFLKAHWGNTKYTSNPHFHVHTTHDKLPQVPLAPPGESIVAGDE